MLHRRYKQSLHNRMIHYAVTKTELQHSQTLKIHKQQQIDKIIKFKNKTRQTVSTILPEDKSQCWIHETLMW